METKKKTLFGLLSKYKIFDNLRRSILPVSIITSVIFATIFKLVANIKIWQIILVSFISYAFPTILDILNYIIFKEGKDSRFIYAYKSFVPNINSIKSSLLRGILEISFLPHKAYMSLNAIVKTIYRMKISKKHLLEWLTAEEAEKQAKTDLISYYKFMWPNVVLGILSLIFGFFAKQITGVILGIIWLLAPIFAWNISKDIKQISAVEKISKQDREYILEIGKKTWQYFKDNINEENNFLPPDNYQEGRANKIARKNVNNKYRTWNASRNFCI